MSLRVLFAIHGPANARTAVYLTTLRRAEFLVRQGHAVDIVTPADLPFGRWSRLQPLLLSPALSVRGLSGYDVVILHSHLAWARSLRPARERSATIVAFHGLEPLYHDAVATELRRTHERLSPQFELLHRHVVPRLLKAGCRAAARVFCLNSEERAFLLANGWASTERIAVMPNGVEPELFSDARAHRLHARRLLFTGQWLRAKGIRYLVHAFDLIVSRYPDAELTCMGTGAGPDTVLRAFSSATRPRVRVLPSVDRSELATELARADLFVFPSLYEGFGNALLEAMAAGLPIVATPTGAGADLLRDGDNAIVVGLADGAALAASACVIMDDVERRVQLGDAAREAAREYKWDRVNQAFADELQRVAMER